MTQFVFLALAVAAVSFTVSKSTMPLIQPLRTWLSKRSSFLGSLLHCPYCTSNWVALAVMLLYRPIVVESRYPAADWLVSWQSLVAAAMVPVFAILFIAKAGE